MSSQDAVKYRAIAARAMFLSQDRTDIGYAVTELSRRTNKPRVRDMKDMKRLGRYLIGKEMSVTTFRRQEGVKVIDVWTDTDYAGCTDTRKSTIGGVVMLGST